MSKKVALICRGYKSLAGSDDLNYLENGVNEVYSSLSSYWEIKEPHVLTDSGDLKREIEGIGEVDEFLFYYIGHGKVESNRFYIVGENNDTINLKDILQLTEKWSTKVTIVLDACSSGEFINQWENKIPYEILTSTDRGYAYEEPTYEMSFFTYHFCRAINKNRLHFELTLENIFDEIHDILITKQRCFHHKIKSYGNQDSNVIASSSIASKIASTLPEPTSKEPSSINKIFLIFNQSNSSSSKYSVVGYIHFEDEFESDLIEFEFQNIYNKVEQQNFIQLLDDEVDSNATLHFIIPSELFLLNFKQWKYNGNTLVNRYHILLHNQDRFGSKFRKYRSMIKDWEVLFKSIKEKELKDALIVTEDNDVRFDTRLGKIGVCFKQALVKYEIINSTLDMAKVGLWQYKEGTVSEYHSWVDGNVSLEELNPKSRECDHMALLWDDMRLLEELKRRI